MLSISLGGTTVNNQALNMILEPRLKTLRRLEGSALRSCFYWSLSGQN